VVIPIGYAQINHVFGGNNLPTGAEVTYGINNTGAELTAAALAESCATIWEDTMRLSYVDDMIHLEVRCKLGPDATGASAVFSVGSPGTDSGAGTTPNVAWLVQKQTLAGGRAGRGRFYLPGISESSVGSDGVIDGTQLANFQGRLDSFLSDLNTADHPMALLHGADSPLTVPNTVQALVASSSVATQRRRLRR
jgi:hypothetical protein